MIFFNVEAAGENPAANTSKGNYAMRLSCAQCNETLASAKRIKVVSDTDIHSFCSVECKDKWILINANDREPYEVIKGVFILCPLPQSRIVSL